MVEPAPRRRLVVFTRYPDPGVTKTRLIPALGPEGAAALHSALVEHVLARVAPWAESAEIELRYTGADEATMRAWLAPTGDEPLTFAAQGDGDLGARMLAAFEDAAAAGVDQTLLFGTDVPAIDAALLEGAFSTLDEADVVFGAAEDGGYYLIGLRAPAPALFSGITWSTETVLAETLERATQSGLALAFVSRAQDVDEPADLRHLTVYPSLEPFYARARLASKSPEK